MPQISRRKLDKKILRRIGEIFLDSIAGLQNRQEAAAFLNDLLTPTEKLMIAKRLAIAVLLARGYEDDSIKDILKVTQNTVTAVKKNLVFSSEEYRKAIKKIVGRKKIKNFFLILEEIFEIMPPKGERWSDWRKRKWRIEMEKQEPF
jgi:uncharacterized protein YerC